MKRFVWASAKNLPNSVVDGNTRCFEIMSSRSSRDSDVMKSRPETRVFVSQKVENLLEMRGGGSIDWYYENINSRPGKKNKS